MKSIIVKSFTVAGERAKQVITQIDNVIVIEKYILSKHKIEHHPGESIGVRSTPNYNLYYHWYSMKLDTLNIINEFVNS